MKQNYLENNLWKRIAAFTIDEPTATFPFSKKIAKQENWSHQETLAVIEEYKKFVFLCCTSPTGASPSDKVDKVWHLHLTYTVNYWEVFCKEVLKQPLHHHPSNGGMHETEKHNNWYATTLKLYAEIFGEKPPPAIWDNNTKHTPKISWWQKSKKLVAVFLVLLCLVGCSSGNDDVGAVFMGVFGIALFVAIFYKASKSNSSSNGSCSGGGDCSSGCGGGCCGGGCGGGCGGCGGCGS